MEYCTIHPPYITVWSILSDSGPYIIFAHSLRP